MAESLRGMLPPVYQPLFDKFFDRPKINETRATCNNCAMCDHGEPSPVKMDFFLPDAKCCTYFPQLPNYLVGAILSDPSPDMEEGKRRIREKIKARVGATPHYLTRPRKMSLVMLGYSEGFGRAKSLLCPYFDTSNLAASCTIWRHREAVCMTYYCKYVDGQRGFDFWVAFKNYLGNVQRRLAKFAAEAVDDKVIEPVFKKNALTLEDIEDLPPKDSDYAQWWGSWVGREEEFYVKCHEWTTRITPEEFALNIDRSESGKQHLDDLVKMYDRLENKTLPTRLVRNVRMKEDHVGDKVVVTTFHRFDSFALDKDLYDVVGLLKADETLEENLQRLRNDGIELEPALIEYLFAAGVLVQPTAARVSEAKTDAALASVRRSALDAVMKARGIKVDETSTAKIAAADEAGLDALIARAANANTIAEVLGEDGET